MKIFKLVESRTEYWETTIEAEDRQDALDQWGASVDMEWYRQDADPDSSLQVVSEIDPETDEELCQHWLESDKLRVIDTEHCECEETSEEQEGDDD